MSRGSHLRELLKFVAYGAIGFAAATLAMAAALGREKPPEWVGMAITLVVGLVGAAGLIFQVHKQRENDRALQAEQFQNELRLKIYVEFADAIEKTNHTFAKVQNFLLQVRLNLRSLNTGGGLGLPAPLPLKERASDFTNDASALRLSVMALLALTEKYEAVDTSLRLYRAALNSGIFDLDAAQWELVRELFAWLPFDIVDSGGSSRVVNVRAPDPQKFKVIAAAIDTYLNIISRLGAHVDDGRTELQNKFVAPMFNNVVPKRAPLDEKYLPVLAFHGPEFEQQLVHFENETPWGQNKKKLIEAATTTPRA